MRPSELSSHTKIESQVVATEFFDRQLSPIGTTMIGFVVFLVLRASSNRVRATGQTELGRHAKSLKRRTLTETEVFTSSFLSRVTTLYNSKRLEASL